MKANRILAIAVAAIGFGLFGSNQAQAAPQFLLPDTNFVSHGPAFSYTLSGTKLASFNLSIDTTKGDFMVIDNGAGFTSASGTISASAEGKIGTIALMSGENIVKGTLISDTITKSPVGKDVFALFRVTSSTMTGVHVGALLGLDGLVFNISTTNGVSSGQIKGDVAPMVPEPASLSLLLLGLGGMTAAARRRLS